MRKLSDFILLPIASKHRVMAAARHAMTLLDQVHFISPEILDRPCVPVRLSRSRREEGGYWAARSAPDRPISIQLSCHASWPALTFAHEVGHYLDNQWLHSLKRGFASKYDLDFSGMKATWEKSEAILSFRGLVRRYEHRVSQTDRKILAEQLVDYEIWARAYAQWFATRSRDSLAFSDLNKARNIVGFVGKSPYNLYWRDDDFLPIAVQIDELLKLKGLYGN